MLRGKRVLYFTILAVLAGLPLLIVGRTPARGDAVARA